MRVIAVLLVVAAVAEAGLWGENDDGVAQAWVPGVSTDDDPAKAGLGSLASNFDDDDVLQQAQALKNQQSAASTTVARPAAVATTTDLGGGCSLAEAGDVAMTLCVNQAGTSQKVFPNGESSPCNVSRRPDRAVDDI
jgi:hypothetical protein